VPVLWLRMASLGEEMALDGVAAAVVNDELRLRARGQREAMAQRVGLAFLATLVRHRELVPERATQRVEHVAVTLVEPGIELGERRPKVVARRTSARRRADHFADLIDQDQVHVCVRPHRDRPSLNRAGIEVATCSLAGIAYRQIAAFSSADRFDILSTPLS
jgi:hypothetical protein